MIEWIFLKDQKPEFCIDILLTDGVRQWIGQIVEANNKSYIHIMSHPDYERYPKNEYGAPFMILSQPTHWMPLPNPPKEI